LAVSNKRLDDPANLIPMVRSNESTNFGPQDLVLPDSDDLSVLNEAAAAWCAQVNAVEHSRDLRRPGRTAADRT
jgi:hypothetical protein